MTERELVEWATEQLKLRRRRRDRPSTEVLLAILKYLSALVLVSACLPTGPDYSECLYDATVWVTLDTVGDTIFADTDSITWQRIECR